MPVDCSFALSALDPELRGTLLQIYDNIAATVSQPIFSPAFFLLWLNVLADFGA